MAQLVPINVMRKSSLGVYNNYLLENIGSGSLRQSMLCKGIVPL